MAIVLAFPLMITFLNEDCSHKKQNVNRPTNESSSNPTSESSSKMENAQIGMWGGEHISLEVTAQGGQVEYDCAHGTIDEKIVLDGQGHFNVRGTHVRERGGPVRRDEAEDNHPARFTGQIKGQTMTVNVTESDTKELVGTFTLVYGQKPHIVKCK